MNILVVDNKRIFPHSDVFYARSSSRALEILQQSDGLKELWLDYDLGRDDTTIPVVDYLRERIICNNPFPVEKIFIHTNNPVEGENIYRSLSRYYKKTNTTICRTSVLSTTGAPAVIIDRDGTLASVEWNRPVNKTPDEWANFNSALMFDAPVPLIAGLFHSIRPDVKKIITTGRPDNLEYEMKIWLQKHNLTPDYLFMRRYNDKRQDSIVKQEIYDQYISPYFNVLYVFDDRPQVVEMWKHNGLPVLPVTDPGVLPFLAQQHDNWEINV